jgi:thiamine pyrophosphokinase
MPVTFNATPPPNATPEFIPLQNLNRCIGIICNGEIEISPTLIEKIKQCSYVIGVDGGLNHCATMGITPNWVVGDFDSVAPEVLKKFQETIPGIALPRAKDCTDLEAAIEKAKNINAYAQVIIWGALGGRLDHTLGNIFVLMRNPGRLFLESEQQVLFGVNSELGEVAIKHATAQTIALFPLTGRASEITITDNDGEQIIVPLLDKCKPQIFPFNKHCSLNVGSGEVLVLLDERELEFINNLPEGNLQTSYSLQTPLTYVFAYLAHQSHHYKTVKWFTDDESICSVQPGSETVSFESKVGLTISLIPLFGPATGLKSEGLKWELGPNTVDRFDKDFVGTLNVSITELFKLSVKEGELVCIINHNVIDTEMVGLKTSDMKLENQNWSEGNLPKVLTQNEAKSNAAIHRKWLFPLVGASVLAFAWIINRYFKTAEI